MRSDPPARPRRAHDEPTARTITLPTGPASILDEGEGPAVVCVHGLPGAGRDFRWLLRPLAGRARVVSVDLPGFGETPVRAGPDPSPEGRAAFVLAVIDALGLDRPMIVGHSMGGVVAVAAVAQRPQGFRALGLVASPGLRPHRAFQRIPRRALFAATHGPWATLTMPLVRRLFAGAGFRTYPDPALVRTIACLRVTSLEAHATRLRALALPTLAAWCDDDPLIEPAILAELSEALPPGPRLRWATGGHVPQKTHPDALAEAIATLVASPLGA
jgi:pimeloyl-ACP methyl ester carboxylesterase